MCGSRRSRVLVWVTLALGVGLSAMRGAAAGPADDPDAEAMQKAFESKDAAARSQALRTTHRNPWLVADLLRLDNRLEVARFLAEGLDANQAPALRAYLDQVAALPIDEKNWATIRKAQALAGTARLKAYELLRDFTPDTRTATGVEVLSGRGELLIRLNRPTACREAFRVAAQAARAIGWSDRAASNFLKAGQLGWQQGAYAEAIPLFEQSARSAAAIGRADREGIALYMQGLCVDALGDPPRALAILARALAKAKEANSIKVEGMALDGMGTVHERHGHSWKALELRREALALAEQGGTGFEVMVARSNLSVTLLALGRAQEAKVLLESSLATAVKLHDARFRAVALINLAIVHGKLGDNAATFRYLEQAEALATKTKAPVTLAKLRSIKASTYFHLGDYARAKPLYEEALSRYEQLGIVAMAAEQLQNLAQIAREEKDPEAAQSFYQRAIDKRTRLGDQREVLRLREARASSRWEQGDAPTARTELEEILSAQEEIKDEIGTALTRTNLTNVLSELGESKRALGLGRESVANAEALGDRQLLLNALKALAGAALRAGDPLTARAAAERGAREMRLLAGGQADEQLASAREQFRGIYAIGALASWQMQDPAGLFLFLESGRASALTLALGGRRQLLAAKIPAPLRAEALAARAAEGRAREARAEARASGKRRALRTAALAFTAARARLEDVIERIERASKRSAELLYARPLTLDVVRRKLKPDEALVVYGLFDTEACALVATRASARIIPLPAGAPAIRKACLALSWNGPEPDAAEKLETVRRLAIAPIVLSASIRRVLISPDGELALAPFRALHTAHELVWVPSGTTYVQLREQAGERSKARDVLAIGDPVYAGVGPGAAGTRRGVGLPRLPDTRPEAEEIGTTLLLGADATEAGFRTALRSKPHWRAIHFATHGLLDTEHPNFSALALTPAPPDDGYLTAAEIARLEVHADLVTLSACDTGRGRIYRAEGVIGLTRAFLFAGAPRVLSSLWKVDSAATRALMTAFYAHWNPKDGSPGVSAAEALREAQASVRADPRWHHPYYWAAWVLTGLPD